MSLDRESAEAILLGLAAGDRIGGPTAMALALAQCLADEGALSPEAVLAAYLAWWKQDGRDTGPTAAFVFRAPKEGASRQEAVRRAHEAQSPRSAGCNPTHRAGPMALLEAFDFAGAPNYSPVLVGALAGARWGAAALPEPMLPPAAVRARAEELAEALAG